MKKENSNQDQLFYTIFLIIFALMIYKKLGPIVISFYYRHHFTLKVSLYLIVISAVIILCCYLYNLYVAHYNKHFVTAKDDTAAFLGFNSESKKPIYLKEDYRKGHTQIIGTTSAGKTESIIFPLVTQDIKNGSGVLIIDGKADESFLNKLYSYVCVNNREKDFRLFSLAMPDKSWSFNPLLGTTHQEIVERAFSIFEFDNDYYKSIQYKIFSNVVRIILDTNTTPNFYLAKKLITDTDVLNEYLKKCPDSDAKLDLTNFSALKPEQREQKISGLEAQLSPFTSRSFSSLYNSECSSFTLNEAMEKNLIVYFQLPTMHSQILGEKTGKMVLQCLQSAVANRQLGLNKNDSKRFFGCFLDDFQDYIYEGFGSLLNKSRSANVSMTFSHQSMGDLTKVSDSFSNIVFTNTNNKVVMRNNDPETCELFSKSFGTKTIKKATSRVEKKTFGETESGQKSVRDAEEFKFSPNIIRNLSRGQGLLSIAHPDGISTMKVDFKMKPDLPLKIPPSIPKKLILTKSNSTQPQENLL